MPRALLTWPTSIFLLLFATPILAQSPAPSTAAPPAAATGSSAERPYTINPGDQIEVYVWGDERLQRTVHVLPDGTFTFPLVGRVVAQGKLPSQIEAAIAKGLTTEYRGQPPSVTVSVTAPSGFTFSVVGRVNTPSSFTPGRYVNLLEAIALAGGPSEFANLDNVTIIRKTDHGLVALHYKLGGAMKGNLSSEAAKNIPQIERGDTVIVP